MGLGVILVDKVDVVGGHHLDAIFGGDAQQLGVDRLLEMECLVVGARHSGLVALQLEVVVVAENLLVPLHLFFGLGYLPPGDEPGNLAAKAGRAAYQPLGVGAQLRLVCARMEIETLGPGPRHDFHQVVVALEVLGQQYEVTALVALVATVDQGVVGHIHLTSEYRLEYLFLQGRRLGAFAVGGLAVAPLVGLVGGFEEVFDGPFGLAVFLGHVVEELLDAEHVAMVGQGDAGHTVGHRLVYQGVD